MSRTPLTLIAGPCALESVEMAVDTAGALVSWAAIAGINVVFKGSFDKANRTSLNSPRGLGEDAGLKCLAEVRRQIGCLVTTDVHEPGQCAPAAEVVDILQIPALLSRQTDLLIAAARTGRDVNVKKGQFMSPAEALAAAEKIEAESRCGAVFLTDRGTVFGYGDIVVDFRGIHVMRQAGASVFLDCTHTARNPFTKSASNWHFARVLGRAAIAVGADGLFIETHPKPETAISDGAFMVPLSEMRSLMEELADVWRAVGG